MITEPAVQNARTVATDPHSFSEPGKAVVKHLDLNIEVDFSKKIIHGKATWQVEVNDDATEIRFDTHLLTIDKVTIDKTEKPWTFKLGKEEKFIGTPLHIPLEKHETLYTIYFSTSPASSAIQWLEPSQTAGKAKPFLFTQCEAILARSFFPCQDSPGVRFTYDATVKVPTDLLPVMSASNPTAKNSTGIYHFEMKQPIPSYLVALAVGDLAFKEVSLQTGVYAEPSVVEKAAYEFADMQKMVDAAEKLYGKYAWDRYDVIVLPPSFPFGGMENPRLTFATPTVIAGDRSLVSLIAHELAHSWSGNLVTNATWNDFWLNEGFTVYFERRIDEALFGKPYADMEALLGYNEMLATLKDLGGNTPATQLKLNLKGKDPDDGMNLIAYEKGFCFIRLVEETIGREKLDAFINSYFTFHKFQSITTENFLEYFNKHLVEPNKEKFTSIDINEWIYKPGLPANCPMFTAQRFNIVDEQLSAWKGGAKASTLQTKSWTTHEWLRFLRQLPDSLTMAQMTELDSAFNFSKSANSEIAAVWFLHSVRSNYTVAYPYIESFLESVGRRKFIIPLYREMIKTEGGKQMATNIYRNAKPNYHFVAQQTVDELLGWKN